MKESHKLVPHISETHFFAYKLIQVNYDTLKL